MKILHGNMMISAEELMGYRRVDASIPRRGPKDNHPDGSDKQDLKLNALYCQQDRLLREKRVTKISNLAVGAWNPHKKLVEVKVEKGKFWQTMGFHSSGKKYLYPEEGLYLLEMNCIELKHHGVPLTMQEAYELMIPSQFSLAHYQVYCHLLRLGYITTRHKDNDITDYGCHIPLQQHCLTKPDNYRNVQGWFQQLDNEAVMDTPYKDEVAPSEDRQISSCSSAGVSTPSSILQPGQVGGASVLASPLPDSASGSSILTNNQLLSSESRSSYSSSPVRDEEFLGTTANQLNDRKEFLRGGACSSCPKRSREEEGSDGPEEEVSGKHPRMDANLTGCSGGGCEDFIEVDLNKCKTLARPLTPPPPPQYNAQHRTDVNEHKPGSFVPTLESSKLDSQLFPPPSIDVDVTDQCCRYSSWNFDAIILPNIAPGQTDEEQPLPAITSISTAKHPMVVKKGNQQAPCKDLQTSSSKTSPRKMGELSVMPKETNPSNWGEYKKRLALEEIEKRVDGDRTISGCPTAHLWRGDVTPLVQPEDATTTGDLFNKLQVICNANLTSEHVRLSQSPSLNLKLDFDVFLPSSTYKKTHPGMPNFHIVVTSVIASVPDLLTIARLLQASTAMLLLAVVDNGDISFYKLKGIELPTDIILG